MIDTHLAGLLVRWLTHDLAGPVTTALTAGELLGDIADTEIHELVQGATRRLAARLKLVRAALAPGEGAIGGAALAALVRDGIGDVAIDWHYHSDCSGAEAAMIGGGALLLADLRRDTPLRVSAQGVHWASDWALPAPVVAALAGAPPIDPRAALAAMIAAAAGRAGRRLDTTASGIGWA